MDYGRKGIRKKRELISSRRLATRYWIKTLILLILLVVLIAGIGYAVQNAYHVPRNGARSGYRGNRGYTLRRFRILDFIEDFAFHQGIFPE